MHLEFLVEEPSAKAALDILVPKIVGPQHSHWVHNFRSKQTLLRQLPSRLRGYAGWIPEDWHIVVLVDEDRQDCMELKATLDDAARDAGLDERVLNRIAVEELEAWFLGDSDAMRVVYPRLPDTFQNWKRFRDPDAVPGGTWEAMDRLLRRNGHPEGLKKIENAELMAEVMDPDQNGSRSFQVFREGLRSVVS